MQVMDFRLAQWAPGAVSLWALSPGLARAQDMTALWQQRPISVLLAMALGLIALVMLVYGVR